MPPVPGHLSAAIPDYRAPGKIRHTLEEMLCQKIYAIGNDAGHLADDPIHKLLAGRGAKTAPALASQSMLCRFENAPRTTDLFRMADALAEKIIGPRTVERKGLAYHA